MATAEQALDWVNRLYLRLSGRRPEVDECFNYFDGNQPLKFMTESWRKAHSERYAGFSDNWCGVVGRSPVDRLRVDGVLVGNDDATVSAEERMLWDDWQRNDLESQSKQGFLASTVAKRSFTLVWGTEGDEPEVSWEHPSQMIAATADSGRRVIAALKAWVEEDEEFATLYLPDGVWKFRRPAGLRVVNGVTPSGLLVAGSIPGGWEPREVPNEPWPLPNPLGEVPVVEWANRPMLGMEPQSDIAGTMAMQDAINLLWAYLFTAADHASMPARVIMGTEPPKMPLLDENGQKIGEQLVKLEDLAKGRFMYLTGQNAKIGQWDAAKLDVFTQVIDKAVAHIAAQTSTPGHYLLTNESFANLNGDALTAAETPLAKKVEAAQGFYTPAVRRTLRLMALVRGNTGLAESLRLARVQWKDAAMHSEASIADAATKDRAVGISLGTILRRRYGMSPDEVAKELGRVQDEAAQQLLAIDRAALNTMGGFGDDSNQGAG